MVDILPCELVSSSDAASLAMHEASLTCGICWQLFPSRGELYNHQKTHTDVQGNRCFVCNQSFTRPFDLQWHTLQHRELHVHDNGTVGHGVLGEIDRSPKNRQNIVGHRILHQSDNQHDTVGRSVLRHSVTDRYDSSSNNRQYTVGHGVIENKLNTNSRSFSNTKKSKSPKKSKTIALDTENCENVKPYTCDVCFRNFTHRHNLNRHKMAHNSKSHVCKVCGRSFKEEFYLEMHLKIHADENTVECEICNEAVDREKVGVHMNRHSEHIEKNPSYGEIGQRVKEILKEQNG